MPEAIVWTGDVNPELRAELTAALHNLVPQTGLLNNLLAIPNLPDNLAKMLRAQLDERARRRTFLQVAIVNLDAVTSAMDRLLADGYPNLEPPTAESLKGLSQYRTDMEAAFELFLPSGAGAIITTEQIAAVAAAGGQIAANTEQLEAAVAAAKPDTGN